MNHYHPATLIRTGLLGLLIATTFNTYAQPAIRPKDYLEEKINAAKKLAPAEYQRFVDLGKLWGVLHLFHPKLQTGEVVTDSLALRPIRLLLAAASEKGFRLAVDSMLKIVDDPGTRLLEREFATSLLFTSGNKGPDIRYLADSTLFLAFPTLSADKVRNPSSIRGLMPTHWGPAKGLIFDIRNAGPTAAYSEYTFIYNYLPMVIDAIAGNRLPPGIFERKVYHSGFVSQTSSTANVYNSGWQTSSAVSFGNQNVNNFYKPVAFIVNQFTQPDIIRQLSALRALGACKIVYEGPAGAYPVGGLHRMQLADGVGVQFRTSDALLPGDQPLPQPDWVVEKITDTARSGGFMQRVLTLMKSSGSDSMRMAKKPTGFALPKPARYADTLVPSADKRLFGLYNFWNVYQYFSPYKAELDHNWDSILLKYVPVFLAADDSLSYMLAVRALASETQDCHGFVNNILPATPARKHFGAWPSFQAGYVGKQLYITEIAKDSIVDLRQLRVGDQITHVDDVPVEILKEQWRRYIPTSNEDTYHRDVSLYLTTGPLNSMLKMTIKRSGKSQTVQVKRTGRWFSANPIDNFNKKHAPVEMLAGNVGYVNMGSLQGAQVDSMMTAFKNTKAIIFDIRNYPQGTAWSIAPRLAGKLSKAVMFDKPFVTNDHLNGGEDQSSLKSFFTVYPAGDSAYKGKVIMLCNAQTQSQAEYTIMMFQGATKTTVIGSMTAGADGNVTDVVMPGGYSITFSGLGIYYTDGTPTQRRGIRVDIPCRPTIGGLMAGKDELLERAIKFIN